MKVLVVDDSTFTRKCIVREILKTHPDWTVEQAVDADDAETKLNETAFDYFTIDFNMPGRDGLDVAVVARDKYPDAKISLLTANKQDVVKNKVLDMGFGFIEKPDFQADLQEFINDA